MLTAIIKALRSADKDVHLTVISGNPDATAAKHNVVSIHRFSPFAVLSAISQCNLLVSGGGSLLQDVTSKRSLLYYLTIIGLGRFFHKKVMLFAQGIGPIKSPILRRLTKIVCSNVDCITVRDKDSLYELRRIGIPDRKVQLTADAVFTLPQVSPAEGRRILEKAGVPKWHKVIAISVRKWQEDDSYLLELAKAADSLVQKEHAHIVLLPLQYPADVEACRQLQEYMVQSDSSTVLEMACDTEQFLSLMGNFDLLIGMRLHALIFAAVMALPFVAISYDPKIDGFVKDINGFSAGNVQTLQAKEVAMTARRAMRQRNQCHDRLEELRDKALLNTQQAFDLLAKQDA